MILPPTPPYCFSYYDTLVSAVTRLIRQRYAAATRRRYRYASDGAARCRRFDAAFILLAYYAADAGGCRRLIR